eukprot:2139400-Pyramimonas_sp.AAC.1
MVREVTAETAEDAEAAECPLRCNQRASCPPGHSVQGAVHANDPREEATYSDQGTAHAQGTLAAGHGHNPYLGTGEAEADAEA